MLSYSDPIKHQTIETVPHLQIEEIAEFESIKCIEWRNSKKQQN